jgi:hypothetical protein
VPRPSSAANCHQDDTQDPKTQGEEMAYGLLWPLVLVLVLVLIWPEACPAA